MKHGLSIWLMAMPLLLASSCGTARKASKEARRQDSIRVEVRTATVYVPDTVYIEIPAQAAERTTADSASHLENDYAASDVRINADGTLYHDLRTKPQERPVVVERAVERNDSIVYRYKYRGKAITVTAGQGPTWWQQAQIYGFRALAALIAIGLLWKHRRLMAAAFARKAM